MKRIILTLCLLGTFVFGVVAYGSFTPPQPELNSGNATVGVVGPDGEPVICANGKELRVDVSSKPTHDPTKVRPPAGTASDKVFRCGLGAEPDRNPRLVPIELDPLRSP